MAHLRRRKAKLPIRSQTAVVAQERNVVVFGKKTEHLGHRVEGLPQALPERDAIGNRAINQLSEGVFEGCQACGQDTPCSLQAALLHGTRRRIQTLGLDPRPLVKSPLQSFGPDGAVRQTMRWQHRKGPSARMAAEALDALLLIPLLPLFLARRPCTGGTGGLGNLGGSTGGIRITFVSPVQVDHPQTAVRALGSLSLELIFSKLNREAFPKSSPPIKLLYFGLHDASRTLLLTNVAHPRSPCSSQRYTTATQSPLNASENAGCAPAVL